MISSGFERSEGETDLSYRIRSGEYQTKLKISRREDGEQEWLASGALVKQDQDRLNKQLEEDILRATGVEVGSSEAQELLAFFHYVTDLHPFQYEEAILRLKRIFAKIT